jgi:hypothetical protein
VKGALYVDVEYLEFHGILNLLFLAKALQDNGRPDLIKNFIDDAVDRDYFYDSIFSIISEIFDGFRNYYNEDNEVETMVFYDPVITEFYRLAADYGKRSGVLDNENPYYKSALEKARSLFGFSHCTGWTLPVACPKKAEKSRLVIYSYPCDCHGPDDIAYTLIMMHNWFKVSCEDLRKMAVTEVIAA